MAWFGMGHPTPDVIVLALYRQRRVAMGAGDERDCSRTFLVAGHHTYTALSNRGRMQTVEDSEHFIQLDDPVAVGTDIDPSDTGFSASFVTAWGGSKDFLRVSESGFAVFPIRIRYTEGGLDSDFCSFHH
jgi:hypothetical protein